ncbi:hypothetical protein KL86SPO_50493 [uncultured Sporomusa sp.]|uniref:Uncharacterized protein n=1 Tax=uncultured Sporomusa sp. TaxID=307249 RepID=A0A212LYV7_9FIRM|nr:hypothetical protein KL86SPO_50493 [uncultured Sporomusa sp.]
MFCREPFHCSDSHPEIIKINPPKKTCETTIKEKQKARKNLKYSTFGQNKNHLLTKVFLSIDGIIFGGSV